MNEPGKETPTAPVTPVAPPTASSLDEFRKAAAERDAGVNVKLPSGLILKLRRPSLSKLLRDKKIPQNLVAAAIRMTQGKQTDSKDDLAENISLMEHILETAIVEPVGMTADDIQALTDEDKGTAFIYIQQGGAGLDSFRNQLTRQTPRSDMPSVSEPKAE